VNYRLVYDVATTSEAPESAMAFGIGALLIALLWAAWLRYRGRRLNAGVKILGVIALAMLALSEAYRFEQRSIGKQTPKLAEGPIAGYWEKSQRRASGSGNFHRQWEGFSVSGVSFEYVCNEEQNYFHNAGTTRLQLQDGMLVRVHYLAEPDGNAFRNQIVKFEVGAP
jgi:hypothetical protein